MRPRLYIKKLDSGYLSVLRDGLQYVGLGARIKRGDTVFIKPNLTFPVFRKGVMTNPECIEALVVALKDYTDRIVIGEADSGGYNRFDMDDVLAKTGLKSIGAKYGIKVVNLSHLPREPICFKYEGRSFQVPLPAMLLHETDLSITMPVPKIHMNTGISCAVKNQWGCIPEPALRLVLHPFFSKVIYEVNKALRTAIAVVDGKYGLNRSGPMLGDPIQLDWAMVSDDIYANDRAVCALMQIDFEKVFHLQYIHKNERRIPAISEMQFNIDYKSFVGPQFYLQKSFSDRLSSMAFRSSAVSYLAYRSPVASLLHKALYLFRRPFYNYQLPSATSDDLEAEI